MITVLVTIYFLLFLLLAWKNFRLGVILFIIFLPTYLIRFEIGSLPSTVLELSFWALFLVWLIKYSRYDIKNIWAVSQKHKLLFIAFDLFFLCSIVSVLISDLFILSLGVWRAYFLEPMILFLILVGRSVSPSYQEGVGGVAEVMTTQSASPTPTPPKRGLLTATDLIWGLALSTVSISAYSVVQKFTGWGIATPEWAGEAMRRVTAFFSSPNAVGLYLAPITMFLLACVYKKRAERGRAFWFLSIVCLLSLIAMFFTKSQGTWIGLGAGLLVFLFLIGYKKIVVGMAVVGVIFSLLIPSMRQAILFKDQAGQNRLRLLGYTQTFLSSSPKNFILGTGLGLFFRKVQKPYYDKIVIERLIYPHNIFINFWTEIGILGMLAITIILGYTFYLANKVRKNYKVIGAGLLGALTVLVVHGLVDVPYFKNDLSFLFWIIVAAILIAYENIYKSQTDVV